MYQSLGLENFTPGQLAAIFALFVGLAFGILAQITKFCLRRAIVGEDQKSAQGVWLMALAVAVLGTQAAVSFGIISFENHRFFAAEMPLLAILLGGIMFGIGMVLTRGCISRMTILSASGNIRAIIVLSIFAITAHATLKGVLSPLRVWIGQATVHLSEPTLFGSNIIWALVISGGAFWVAFRSKNKPKTLILAALIGALVPLAWITTGYLLYDDFDPIEMSSLAFTSSVSDALFYTIASTAISPGFGVALVAGVLIGALVSSLIRKEFAWVSFESAAQTGRYILGAVLMGFGGVLAGGCTVGVGLSGVPTLSIAAILAFGSIIFGAWGTNRILQSKAGANLVPSAS